MKTSSDELLRDLLVQHCTPTEKQEIKESVKVFVEQNKSNYDSIQLQHLDDYLRCSLTPAELTERIQQIRQFQKTNENSISPNDH